MNRKLRTLALALGTLSAGMAFAPAAFAAERPFVLGGTAVQEDDDERVWEVATRLEARRGGDKALDLELEYAFVPSLSVELGWARRLGDDERETELEFGLRHVWRDPARHGLGVAFTLEVEAQREVEEGGEREGWRYGTTTFTMPLSRQWESTGLWTHLTLGAQHERAEGTRPLAVLGLQQPITRRLEAFGEWGAVREREGLLHAGLRWWVQREKVALDVSVLRRRDGAERPESLLIGLNVMDLSF